jgi:hypothetical protein
MAVTVLSGDMYRPLHLIGGVIRSCVVLKIICQSPPICMIFAHNVGSQLAQFAHFPRCQNHIEVVFLGRRRNVIYIQTRRRGIRRVTMPDCSNTSWEFNWNVTIEEQLTALPKLLAGLAQYVVCRRRGDARLAWVGF